MSEAKTACFILIVFVRIFLSLASVVVNASLAALINENKTLFQATEWSDAFKSGFQDVNNSSNALLVASSPEVNNNVTESSNTTTEKNLARNSKRSEEVAQMFRTLVQLAFSSINEEENDADYTTTNSPQLTTIEKVPPEVTTARASTATANPKSGMQITEVTLQVSTGTAVTEDTTTRTTSAIELLPAAEGSGEDGQKELNIYSSIAQGSKNTPSNQMAYALTTAEEKRSEPINVELSTSTVTENDLSSTTFSTTKAEGITTEIVTTEMKTQPISTEESFSATSLNDKDLQEVQDNATIERVLFQLDAAESASAEKASSNGLKESSMNAAVSFLSNAALSAAQSALRDAAAALVKTMNRAKGSVGSSNDFKKQKAIEHLPNLPLSARVNELTEIITAGWDLKGSTENDLDGNLTLAVFLVDADTTSVATTVAPTLTATTDATTTSASVTTAAASSATTEQLPTVCRKSTQCYGRQDCAGKPCIGGKKYRTCNCRPCINQRTCKTDTQCGELIGACQAEKCECKKALLNHGLNESDGDGFCNVKSCLSTNDCFGLPCQHGNCNCESL